MKKRVEKSADGKTDIITAIPENADEYDLILQCMECGLIDDGGYQRTTETGSGQDRAVLSNWMAAALAGAEEVPVSNGTQEPRTKPSKWRLVSQAILRRGRHRRKGGDGGA